MQRSEIDGRQRERVFAALQSFDGNNLSAAHFEQKCLELIRIPEAHSAVEVLEHYRRKFAAWNASEIPQLPSIPEPMAECADGILKQRFSFYGEAHTLPAEIDWEFNPGTAHWGHDLNRFAYLAPLVHCYRQTGERRFADKVAGLIVDWISDTDICDAFIKDKSPFVWNCYLNISIHLEAWVGVISSLLKLLPDLLSPADFLRILKSIHDQLAYLQLVIPEARNNWVTIGARGMLVTLSAFPEFHNAEAMTTKAWERLEAAVADQVLPDGVQDELSPHYHLVVINCLLSPLAVESRLPKKAPGSLKQTLRKMLHYLAQTNTPDGKHLNFNDSFADCGEQSRRALEHPVAREIFAADAKTELKSECFPYGGIMILRQGSNRGRDEIYLAFDGGPYGTAHQHEDKLSFHLSAYGRSLLVDPGMNLYDWSEQSFHSYLVSSKAHSTISIDGCGQNSKAHRNTPESWRSTRPQPLRWDIQSDGKIVAGASYDLGYGPDLIAVKHIRTIVFDLKNSYFVIEDEVLGDGCHLIESHFQFAPGELRLEQHGFLTAFPDANVLLKPLSGAWDTLSIEKGMLDPKSGWYSDGYHKLEPAPIAVLTARNRTLPFRCRTLVYPFAGTQVPELSETFR
jgi:uncharacterized heparinase superfamily protein